jgi:hypothetical protein
MPWRRGAGRRATPTTTTTTTTTGTDLCTGDLRKGAPMACSVYERGVALRERAACGACIQIHLGRRHLLCAVCCALN